MRKALFVMAAAIVALFAFGASTASAAPAHADATHAKATCHYSVHHSGGIKIRNAPRNNATVVGSLANGAKFYATCDNVGGDFYTDCGVFTNLWKHVPNGYVKTKCLARI